MRPGADKQSSCPEARYSRNSSEKPTFKRWREEQIKERSGDGSGVGVKMVRLVGEGGKSRNLAVTARGVPGAPAIRGDTSRTLTRGSTARALRIPRSDLQRAVTGSPRRGVRAEARGRSHSRPACALPPPGSSPRALALLRPSRRCSGGFSSRRWCPLPRSG